jgi:hypothetical protein
MGFPWKKRERPPRLDERRERSAEIENDKEQSGAEPVKIPVLLPRNFKRSHRALALF